MGSKCYIWFCSDEVYAKGLCRAHYTNLGRYGMPIAPSNKDVIRLIKKLATEDKVECAWNTNSIKQVYDTIVQYERAASL